MPAKKEAIGAASQATVPPATADTGPVEMGPKVFLFSNGELPLAWAGTAAKKARSKEAAETSMMSTSMLKNSLTSPLFVVRIHIVFYSC